MGRFWKNTERQPQMFRLGRCGGMRSRWRGGLGRLAGEGGSFCAGWSAYTLWLVLILVL
jgi:hypothetical protein